MALEELIQRHQAWIYNIALRMVCNPQDAEDVTQEVLLKIITKLSTFRGESSFRTWVYRIVANHVINMKKRSAEEKVLSFNEYWKRIENTPDMDLPDQRSIPVNLSLVIEEIKIYCMMVMLLCLNRNERLIFILGEIFGASDKIGSEILEISKDNFRQRLLRARRKIYNFIQEKCSLVNKNNPCHCERKVRALIDKGHIDPNNLKFNCNYFYKVNEVLKEKYRRMKNFLDLQCQSLFRKHPFQTPSDFVKSLREVLQSSEFKDVFNF